MYKEIKMKDSEEGIKESKDERKKDTEQRWEREMACW